jgi:hypothetical protein
MSEDIPHIVFIVPYRNRPYQKYFFINYMNTILEHSELKYEIYFSHQCDIRSFNRGGVKNIGFLAIKEKYPFNYQDITFVFNDIDTIPFSNIFDYQTNNGVVKHFYGFTYALGGIVSLTGYDFELINGFPNYWGWGMEDNVLQKRCENAGLKIDRSHFYKIGSPQILHLFDGISRIINNKDPWRATTDNGIDGIKTIHKLEYSIDEESSNPNDILYIPSLLTNKIFFINIRTFLTAVRFESDTYKSYDLREPPRKITNPNFQSINNEKPKFITDDWSNIPFYPTNENKQSLIQTYGKEKAEEIIKYSYKHSTEPTKYVVPEEDKKKALQKMQKIKQYNLWMQQRNLPNRIIPNNVNKYSKEYEDIIKPKQRATTSAKIRLGGIY